MDHVLVALLSGSVGAVTALYFPYRYRWIVVTCLVGIFLFAMRQEILVKLTAALQ